MRKLLLLTIVLVTMACDRSEPITDFPAPEAGVIIKGVHWATRNVAAPGTFAANPEDAGMFFQWNRRMGWTYINESPVNADGATNWASGNPGGAEWAVENNPCPPGWRVPTQEEWMSLRDAGSRWQTVNGVEGRLFGSVSNGIFLPAAGFLYGANGGLRDEATLGLYWSSTPSGNNQARNITFSSRLAGMRPNPRNSGYSIRCVRAPVTGVTLNETSLLLVVGVSKPIVATVEPACATNRNVTWTSANPSIAVVDDNGIVTAVSVGTASIIATTVDGEKTASSTVTVVGLNTSLSGVTINGRRWATRNVDTPGYFVDSPANAGMFYQWNRRIGWTYTDTLINSNGDTTWDYSVPAGIGWTSLNNPCPRGWRVPTASELEALKNQGSVWMTYNGVHGRLFGTIPNVIFLPAAGWLYGDDGERRDRAALGFYWSSTANDHQARNLTFSNNLKEMRSGHRNAGYTIRCIAE